MLIPIRYKKLSILWNMKASHNSNEEATVLFIPHAVFQSFVLGVVGIAEYAENLPKGW